MLTSLRRVYAELVTSGAQLFLLVIALKLQSRPVWIACLVTMAAISLFTWYSALYRLRLITGTPTSTVASAAQGYVELAGTGEPHGTRLLSKLTALPCLWYRYRIEEKTGKNEWRTIEKGQTHDPFLLDDGSGTCLIDPEGAEILTQHKDVWHNGAYRYTEWKLLETDDLYAIGEFRTAGGSTVDRTLHDEIKFVLEEWKHDMPKLRERFDLNNDGTLDMQEWMLARQAAKREAEKRLQAARAEPDINFLVRPKDGRLFLISNLDQDKLALRYRLWSWAHLTIMLGALGGLGWLLGK